MSEALDLVDNNILLRKLEEHGIWGEILVRLSDNLTDCTVRVRVDDALTDPATATSGVPRGSVLEPIHYSLK